MAKQTLTVTLTLVIDSALVFVPVNLPKGAVGQAYGPVQLQVTGGIPPYNFSAVGLPTGLSLSFDGILSGIPTQGGSFSPVVSISDSGTP